MINGTFSYGVLSMVAGYLFFHLDEYGNDYIEKLIPYEFKHGKNHGKNEGDGYLLDIKTDAKGLEPQLDELNHRFWKHFTIMNSGVRRGAAVLDIAGGTGDLTRQFSKLVGDTGKVVLADINASMLNVGRDRLTDDGIVGNIEYVVQFHSQVFAAAIAGQSEWLQQSPAREPAAGLPLRSANGIV